MTTAPPPRHPSSSPGAGFAPRLAQPGNHGHGARARVSLLAREDSSSRSRSEHSSSSTVAHTLTACTRCRQRKTRCDPGLPRCGPCERTNSVCEYYDASKGHNVNRSYVVYLQHRLRELERELERVENDDGTEDPEAMMRAATVRVHEAQESKYLGPSSGIAITRLVMQLAKQFTEAKSIKDIVPEYRAMHIKELYNQEQAKPTSKVYPLISNVPALELPKQSLRNLLVQLYKLKVQILYPALHEPTLDKDIEAVYQLGEEASAYQNFVCRMVVAISLQKLEAQYAGLADSYYLAALKYLEPVVKPMDLRTLQCFALMAEYSLLTPTRTAIYYVVGIAVRLAQALGLNEEKTIVRGAKGEGSADPLEIDMRRRLFWCIHVMDFGLSHSLGRPAILATRQEHLDVGWFETCDDKYITSEGIAPNAERPTLRKWIAIHFFKMRMLQLEIRRKLYLRKRPTPRSDKDDWFVQMHAKLQAWKDAAPSADEASGLDNSWFVARFNTMVVFLYRPSPQVPRPSLDAALRCFAACEYNIYKQREQISRRNVDMTWVFTQSLFMAINTMLWSLSYDEVRRQHKREAVEGHLSAAMETIYLASERWPGVASAISLYDNLIRAILQIYGKDGDIPITVPSPPEETSSSPPPFGLFVDPQNRSRNTSPATASSITVATPPEHRLLQQRRNADQQATPPPMHYQSDFNALTTPPARPSSASTSMPQAQTSDPATSAPMQQPYPQNPQQQQQLQQQSLTPSYFDPYSQYNALPQFTPGIGVAGWNHHYQQQPQQQIFSQSFQTPYSTTTTADPTTAAATATYTTNPLFNPSNPAYPFPATADQQQEEEVPPALLPPAVNASGDFAMTEPGWDMDAGMFGGGLTQLQQQELMYSLETQGEEDIRGMISSTLAAIGSASGGHLGGAAAAAGKGTPGPAGADGLARGNLAA